MIEQSMFVSLLFGMQHWRRLDEKYALRQKVALDRDDSNRGLLMNWTTPAIRDALLFRIAFTLLL